MRKLTELVDTKTATRLNNYLHANNIDCTLRKTTNNESTSICLWVMDDDKLQAAKDILNDFLKDPSAKRFDAEAPKEKPITKVKEIDVRTQVFNRSTKTGAGNITLAIIFFSCVVTLFLRNQMFLNIVGSLFFSLPAIFSGQIWRLITPIFLHGDFWHLLFNMLWLYQLGGQIEAIKGSRYYIVMMVSIGIICNISQYVISGPNFLGMSGVIYGFLGFIWMDIKHSPTSRFILNEQVVFFMLIWLVICWVGIIGNVANTQHIMGMLSGTAWGYISSGGMKNWLRRRRR
ncbi:MAG: rhomboid family intramembrane serine protease [Bdellovibrionota bacterium]